MKEKTPECTFSICCLCRYGNMCNMTDTRQRLSPEAVRCYGLKVLEALEFTGSEALADDRHVIFLELEENVMHIVPTYLLFVYYSMVY